MSIMFECKKKAEGNNSQSSIESLVINNSSMKTDYIQGDTLDLTGIQIQVILGPLTIDVTQYCTFNPTNGTVLTSDNTSITATFLGVSGSTPINVYEIDEIAVTTLPTKAEYQSGQTLDLTGIVVTATAGQLTKDVTSSCTFNPANGLTVSGEDGTYSVSVTYGSVSTSFNYTIASIPSSLEEASWDWVVAKVRNGTLANYFPLGSTKTVTVDGQTFTYQLASVNDGTAKNNKGESLAAYYPAGTADFVPTSAVYTGRLNSKGWYHESAAFTYLNGTFYNKIPTALKKYIVQRKLGAENGYDNNYNAVEPLAYVWDISAMEIAGKYDSGTYSIKGKQYSIFNTDASRIRSVPSQNWTNEYFTRTHYTSNNLSNSYYYKVYDNGTISVDAVPSDNPQWSVAYSIPCFRIG